MTLKAQNDLAFLSPPKKKKNLPKMSETGTLECPDFGCLLYSGWLKSERPNPNYGEIWTERNLEFGHIYAHLNQTKSLRTISMCKTSLDLDFLSSEFEQPIAPWTDRNPTVWIPSVLGHSLYLRASFPPLSVDFLRLPLNPACAWRQKMLLAKKYSSTCARSRRFLPRHLWQKKNSKKSSWTKITPPIISKFLGYVQ